MPRYNLGMGGDVGTPDISLIEFGKSPDVTDEPQWKLPLWNLNNWEHTSHIWQSNNLFVLGETFSFKNVFYSILDPERNSLFF